MGLTSLHLLYFFTLCVGLGSGLEVSELQLLQGSNVNPENCNKGQHFWCQNIMTAVSCSAFKHCVQSVWETEIPIESDKSEVCQVCLDMVKQARDQLQSNETQQDIKAVLDGTCKLIPLKEVQKECIKLMNDFASQLVDMLASQMNPQVVCSVAGLCNNNKISLLEQQTRGSNVKKVSKELNCNSCHSLIDHLKKKIEASSSDEIQDSLTQICGNMGSYSDSCSALVSERSLSIVPTLKKNILPGPICSLVGVCSRNFHQHETPVDSDMIVSADIFTTSDNDLPCDLCEQLISHLKDILIANTTEEEFKLVLEGLCKQMGAYKDECIDLVKQYYEMVYAFLVEELNGKVLCKQMKLCPDSKQQFSQPIFLGKEQKEIYQLPIERMNPFTFLPKSYFTGSKKVEDNKALCAMCEYFLHFVQQEITLPSTEDEIKKVVMEGCDRLPKTVAPQCNSFVETYMDAFIALLANRIDPSQVCPSLGVCPGDLIAVEYNDKPTCPLCLLAMEEILSKPHDTKGKIADILDDLCLRNVFPNSLSVECVKFVTENRKAIIDMVMAEFTSQESCVYIESCVAPDLKEPSVVLTTGNIETNEILEMPVEISDIADPQACTLCQFVMTKLDDILKEPKTQDEIRDAVYHVCNYMPKSVSQECKKFVLQYAELVIELIVQEVAPKEICTALNLCGSASLMMQNEMEKCLLCEVLMDGLKVVITDQEVDENINRNLEKACDHIPSSKRSLCMEMVSQLAPQIEMALRTLPIGPLVCKRIHLCGERRDLFQLLSGFDCSKGPSYWCQSTATAAACNNIEYCQEVIWKADKPKRSHNKGRIVINY